MKDTELTTAKISVIIPVYNAEPYIETAVNSALAQPEVGEVLLIEDGSPDESLQVCQRLAKEHKKVHLFQHAGGENRGPSASRNLGMEKASCDYIAFLDADDFYLPDRFCTALQILNTRPEIDGVYEATSTKFEDRQSQHHFEQTPLVEIMTVTKDIQPEALFEAFMLGKAGSGFHLNGFTCRRSIFQDQSLRFNNTMWISQDTLLIYQLSAKTNLIAGDLEHPVAIQRIHPKNRITQHMADPQLTYQSRLTIYENLLSWSRLHLGVEQTTLVLLKYLYQLKKIDQVKNRSAKDVGYSRIKMVQLLLRNTILLLNPSVWKFIRTRQLIKIGLGK